MGVKGTWVLCQVEKHGKEMCTSWGNNFLIIGYLNILHLNS